MGSVRFSEVGGARLAYEDSGTGEAVVLIHGMGLDRRMWDDQVPALEPGYRVVRYDMRGFGESDFVGTGPYTHAADLKALLDFLAVERAVVAGLSLGGTMALHFALAFPEMVRGLVLVDAVVGGWEWTAEEEDEMRRAWVAGRERGVEAAREEWLAHPLFAPANENPAVAPRLRAMVTDYSGYHWTHVDPHEWPEPPALARLGEIRCPTLVIVGARDLPGFLATAGALSERIAGASKVIIPGAGHMANMEAPQEVNGAMLAFLANLPA
jgi:pimeloyl-ACP methyl ester carboxylesterase